MQIISGPKYLTTRV